MRKSKALEGKIKILQGLLDDREFQLTELRQSTDCIQSKLNALISHLGLLSIIVPSRKVRWEFEEQSVKDKRLRPKVTMEFVEKWAKEFYSPIVGNTIKRLIKMFKELGVEIND